MLAAVALPSETVMFILGFVAVKICLIGLLAFWVSRKFPALFRGLRRRGRELQQSFHDGLEGR